MLGPLNAFDINSILEHFPQWRHLSQSRDFRDDSFNRVIHLFIRGEPTNTKP